MDLSGANWRKSTRSNGSGGDCVEVCDLDGGYHAVRDSKNPTGPALVLPPAAWQAFIASIRHTELD